MERSEDRVSSAREMKLDQLSMKKNKPSQRVPKCTRCQNHGEKVQVKFHKRECKYRFCICQMCILTTKRQQIMKLQTAKRRAIQQEELLMEMRKKDKAKDSETPPGPSINGSNDSNSSETPSLSNNYSNSSIICRSINEPVPSIPLPQNLPPPLSHTSSPVIASLFEPELNPTKVQELLGYSAKLLQRFGYHWQMSLTLMYVILKDSRLDIEVAQQRITEASSEIQRTAAQTAQYSALFGSYYRNGGDGGGGGGGGGYYYAPAYTHSLANVNNLGNPTYFGHIPYVGMASPASTSGLGLLPYTFGSHVVSPRVPSSPDSPPERPSSYPEAYNSHRLKIEDTD